MIQRTILGRSTKKITAAFSSIVAVAVAFGLGWDGQQVALVTVAFNLVIGLIANEDAPA